MTEPIPQEVRDAWRDETNDYTFEDAWLVLRNAYRHERAMRRKVEHKLEKATGSPHDCDACLCPMTDEQWLQAVDEELKG